jgi:hypothetical protein
MFCSVYIHYFVKKRPKPSRETSRVFLVDDAAVSNCMCHMMRLSTLIKRFERFLPVSNVGNDQVLPKERSAITLLPKTTRMVYVVCDIS